MFGVKRRNFLKIITRCNKEIREISFDCRELILPIDLKEPTTDEETDEKLDEYVEHIVKLQGRIAREFHENLSAAQKKAGRPPS